MSTMIQPTKNKYGVYTLRMAVPADLKNILGKGELKRSLQTKDLAEAKRKAPAVIDLLQAEIDAARRTLHAEQAITKDDIERIAYRWLTFILPQPELINERYLVDSLYGLDLSPESRIIRCYLEKNDDYPNYSAMPADDLFNSPAINVPDDYQQRDIELLQLLRHELKESLELTPVELTPTWKVTLAWRLADYRMQAAEMHILNILPKYAATAQEKAAKPTISFSMMFERYKEHVRYAEPREAEKRIKAYETAVNRFEEFIGSKPIEDITKHDMADFRQLLERLPCRPSKAVKKLPLKEQAELSGEKISPQTVRNQLMALSSIFRLATEDELISENPVSLMPKRKRQRQTPKERGFTRDEIALIFNTPLFHGEETPHGAMAYWVPIILYYTGARVEEITQLYTENIIRDSGIYCIQIESTDEQSTKTGLSRVVPLHSHIIDLGFLEYVKSREHYLFTKRKTPSGKSSYNFLRWWGKYIRSHGITRKEIKQTHGFRHTFITHCRSINARKDIQNDITGHAQEDVSGGYGSYPIEAKKELIQTIPQLELPVLDIWKQS